MREIKNEERAADGKLILTEDGSSLIFFQSTLVVHEDDGYHISAAFINKKLDFIFALSTSGR